MQKMPMETKKKKSNQHKPHVVTNLTSLILHLPSGGITKQQKQSRISISASNLSKLTTHYR